MQTELSHISSDMALSDLLPLATKLFNRELELPPGEISLLIDLLRLKGEEELTAGEQVDHGCVHVEKRRNGFVRVLFGSD